MHRSGLLQKTAAPKLGPTTSFPASKPAALQLDDSDPPFVVLDMAKLTAHARVPAAVVTF